MAKKYIDAELLRKKVEKYYDEYRLKFNTEGDPYYLGVADGLDVAERVIDSLQQQTDGILNSYIEQRCKELDTIIQEEMTPDNTVTTADKIGAMTAKNELLRIKELI